MEAMINAYKMFVRKSEGERQHEHLDGDRRILLKWTLEKQDGKMWTGFI
jgi:hypothetical protein